MVDLPQTHRPALRKLLSLHAVSTALQSAHSVARDADDHEAAASLHRMGEEVARLIGLLVVAESKLVTSQREQVE